MSLPTEVSLVVVERGARFPAFIARERVAPDCRVISQQAGETPGALTQRVVARLRALTAVGTAVRTSVVAVGGDRSEAAAAARYRIARALVVARPLHASAELVIATPGPAPRHDLYELAGAVCSTLGSTEVTVRVRTSSDGSAASKAA